MHADPIDYNGRQAHRRAVLVALALTLSSAVWARDHGVVGPVYLIAEIDLLQQIHQRLQVLQDSGQLARLQAEDVTRGRRSIETPPPVAGLHKASAARVWHFDPSVRFDEPVQDASGRVVVPAGTLANPLVVLRMPADWMLFDGRDPAQVSLARSQLDEAAAAGRPIKPILVAGSPLQLAQAWQRPVYFDQHGRITRRLGLSAVPARVSQDGLSLRVQEFVAR